MQQIGSQYRFQTLKVRDSLQSPFLQQLVQQFSGFFSHTTLHQNPSPKKPVSTSPVELRRCLRNWRNSCRKRLVCRPQEGLRREGSRRVEENSDGVFAEISIVFFPPVLKTQPKHVPHSFGFQTRSMFYPFLGPSRIINF